MPAAGALAASKGNMTWFGAGLAGTLGEIVGGSILYAIGYAGGRPFVVRYGKYVKLSEKKLDQFHGFYTRKGNIVVFVCRFLPFVRGVSALPAGVSKMRCGRTGGSISMPTAFTKQPFTTVKSWSRAWNSRDLRSYRSRS